MHIMFNSTFIHDSIKRLMHMASPFWLYDIILNLHGTFRNAHTFRMPKL